MRSILLATTATVAIFFAIGLFSGGANALTQSAPFSLREAADGTNLVQDARWVCRYSWYGRRHCWWVPNHRQYWRHRHYWRDRYR